MEHDQVQPLNYCAHAIEDLRNFEEKVLRRSAPQTARVFSQLIEMLQQSVKFILPNCCNLIDPEELRQTHLDLVRLPFPCVAFEAPWQTVSDVEQIGEFKQTPATKRIALCWEPSKQYELLPGLNDIIYKFPEGGAFVLPIYWASNYKTWTVALGGSFVPYRNTLRAASTHESLPASRIAKAAAVEAGLTKPQAKEIMAEPFYLQPEYYELLLDTYRGDVGKVYAQIILDSRDETMMLIQACSVINCVNVATTELNPPAALNKKRKETGKQPFFSYKVLQLSDERHETVRSGATGERADPRMHLRRGHLRRLESKMIWVRPTMVNATSKSGAVFKDYSVQQKA